MLPNPNIHPILSMFIQQRDTAITDTSIRFFFNFYRLSPVHKHLDEYIIGRLSEKG
jgi:hypothetical protein